MRIRDVLAVLVGIGVVAGVGIGGWMWLEETVDPEPEIEDDASTTATAYVQAWEAGDLLRMASLVREAPEDFAARHDQLLTGLEATDLRIERGEVDSPVDGRATVPLTVTVDVAVLAEPVSWDTELRLLRERGTWGVDWSLSTIHPELRPTWRFGTETVDIDRELILAADGTPLAGPGTRITFGFQPALVSDPDAVIEAFATALPGSEVAAERELARGDLRDDWFYPVVTVSEARADEASTQLRRASGIVRRTGQARTLLDDGFAQHVVGVVAPATAEQLEQLGPPYEAGDVVGQYGLEAVFEADLIGSELTRVGLRDGEAGAFREIIGEGRRDPSRTIQTTIDVTVQRAVENALRGVTDPAAIVVVDGATGAIVGSASRPLSGFDRALSGRYPPGSTFKIVTAEAALATGAGLDDEVECPAETLVGGLRVPNAGARSLGTTTLLAAFAESCNTTFARIGAALGADAMVEAAQRFGFGVDPIVPLPAFGGSFPDPGDTAEVGAAAFGQARVEASPLQLASMAAAAATGTWHQPYLLVDDGPGESRPLATGAPEPLREMLRAVVTDGTGTEAAVDGEEVLGKTGTAQGTGGVEHAWFIGSHGDLGFAVLVEDGGAGSEVAAPIAARFVRELVALTTGDVDPMDAADLDGELDDVLDAEPGGARDLGIEDGSDVDDRPEADDTPGAADGDVEELTDDAPDATEGGD